MKTIKMHKTYYIMLTVALGVALLMLAVVCLYAFGLAQLQGGEGNVLIALLLVTVLALYICPQMLFFQGVTLSTGYISLRRCGFLPQELLFSPEDVMFCTARESKKRLMNAYTLQFYLKDGQQLSSSRLFFDEASWHDFQKSLPNYYAWRRAVNMRPRYSDETRFVKKTRYYWVPLIGLALLCGAYILYTMAI